MSRFQVQNGLVAQWIERLRPKEGEFYAREPNKPVEIGSILAGLSSLYPTFTPMKSEVKI